MIVRFRKERQNKMEKLLLHACIDYDFYCTPRLTIRHSALGKIIILVGKMRAGDHLQAGIE